MHLWLPSLQSDLNSNELQQTFAHKKSNTSQVFGAVDVLAPTPRKNCYLKNVAFLHSCLLSSEWNVLKISIKSLKSNFLQGIDKVFWFWFWFWGSHTPLFVQTGYELTRKSHHLGKKTVGNPCFKSIQHQGGLDVTSDTHSSDADGTFLGSILISPLDQQVARTLRQERQYAELQHCWERQEGKQEVPSGLLQSMKKTGSV